MQYGDVAPVYDALMAVVPHASWLSRIERVVRDREKSPQSVLDIACGTGIVSEDLYRRGYRPVVGFDLSESMIRVARTKAQARNLPIEYHVADAATVDLDGQRFELLISMFDSLNYILDPERLAAAFHRFYAHAAPGALLIFDMNSLYALSSGLFTQKEDTGPVRHDWLAHWDRETRECRVEMDFWVTDDATGTERHFHETHRQRAYTIPEIRSWLTDAGWTKIDVFGNYTDRAPAPRSDRLLFVAERAS